MAIRQTIYKSGAQQRSQARRLIASAQGPAQHVTRGSLSIEEYADYINPDKDVALYRAHATGLVCGTAVVMPGQQFYLVRSRKFSGRFYVVVWNRRLKAWQCSSEEDRCNRDCIYRVLDYRARFTASEPCTALILAQEEVA